MEIPKSSGEGSPNQEGKLHLDNEASRAYLDLVKSREQARIAKEPLALEYNEFVAKNKQIDFFAKAGAAPYIMNTYSYTMKMYDGSWRSSVNNPAFVKAVGDDVALQNNLLLTGELKTPYTMKENNLGVDTAPEDIAFKKVDSIEKKEEVGPGEAVFASMASQLSKYGEKAPEGKKENNSLDFVEYTKEDHEAIAQEYTDSIIKSNANPEDYAAELARKVEKSRTLAAEQNSDLTKIGGESEEIRKFKEDVARYNAKEGDIIRPFEQLTEKTIEEKKALTEKFLTLTKESAPKVEETQEALKNKQEQSIKKLEGMGLTRVGKALEAFKNMSSKKKLALGIALAGLSVATGGATSFVSTGLSALTFGLRDYDKEKAKAAERGVETDKMTMLKSAVTGLVLALGTSALFHIAGDAVGAASEKLSPMIENLKHFFSPETVAAADSLSPGEVIVPVGPDVVPHSPVSTVTPDIATAPQTVTESAFSHTPDTTAPVEVVTQSAVEVPQSAPITDQYLGKIEVPPYVPSAINFGDMDYTIKAGDTYSNIMDRILPHVRGVELLDPTSKAELLKNFHEQYSSTGTFSGLSSYPDMISNIDGAKVGTEIRVDQLRGALEEEVKRRFPGNFSN
jgi:hypothetical protein